MRAVKNYFGDQFQLAKFGLEYDDASEFVISSLQKNRKTLPLLCVRLVLFLGCVSLLITSFVLSSEGSIGYWFIYMTNWGVILITVATGLAFAVSAKAFFKGPIDSTFQLPWFLKVFWATYNTAIVIAFFITVFYYSFLYSLELEVDPVLDLFVHGINSVVVFVLLWTSQHPSQILHFWQPLGFGIVYMAFSLIYYYAGGVNENGDPWIYPILDWSNPGLTVAMVFGSVAFIVVMHWIVALISLLRDVLTSKYVRKVKSIPITRI